MEIATEILCMLFLLMIAISCGHFLKKMSISATMDQITKHFVGMFMIMLLPPIIFESGYNMQKKPFLRNMGTVMMFSFVGTFIAIFFSSGMFYLTGLMGWSYPFTTKDSFAFGSLISATDPVAVLAIFKEMDADENLYAIVFGESIFNDAIGIVMYDTVKHIGMDPLQSTT